MNQATRFSRFREIPANPRGGSYMTVSNSQSSTGTGQHGESVRHRTGFALSMTFAVAFSIGGIVVKAAAQTYAPAYENMPAIPPIGVRTGKYTDVPEFAKGPAVDAAKSY